MVVMVPWCILATAGCLLASTAAHCHWLLLLALLCFLHALSRLMRCCLLLVLLVR
jgi:hypothetical protein